MATYLYKVTPCRPALMATITPAETEILQTHFAYLQQALTEGRLILAGPCLDAAFGVVIFEAETEEAAHLFMAGDPAVIHGLMTAELHPFRVSLMRERQ